MIERAAAYLRANGCDVNVSGNTMSNRLAFILFPSKVSNRISYHCDDNHVTIGYEGDPEEEIFQKCLTMVRDWD